MNLSKTLYELRKRKGMSQEELAGLLGVSRQTVSNWELGETTPNAAQLLQLSKIFNIKVDGLLSEKEIKIERRKIQIAFSVAFALISCVIAFGLNRFRYIEILFITILCATAGYAIGVAVDAITEKLKNK